jgi:hypothetical protein
MNVKRFVLATIAVFIFFQITAFIIHGLILNPIYQQMADVWRPDMMSKMWIMYITSLIFSFVFVYVFSKGYENRGIGEGIRFGIIMGLLILVVGMFNQYAVYLIPFSLALKWFISGMIEYIIAGIIVSLIYKPAEKA